MPDIKLVAKNCLRVYTPTQRGSTCWFAALMMTLFFSQRMRAVSASHSTAIVKKNDWREPIAEAMVNIMMNYEVNSLDRNIVGKLEPRAFLRALRRYDPVYFDSRRGEEGEGASYGPYQHKLLSFLEIPHLSVSIPRGSTDAIYSAYNLDLPLDEDAWEAAVGTLDPVGAFVDTESPKVIIVHREAGESYLQKTWKSYRPRMYAIKGFNLSGHPEKITYNKRAYILDSCILPSYISNTCSAGHAVAGITCNGDKYVYNGWAARSGDPAMGGTSITREIPCALMQSDWVATKSFCIDANACTITRKKKNEMCFEAFKRSSVVYVRDETINTIPVKTTTTQTKTVNAKPPPTVNVESAKQKLKKLNALKKKVQSLK